MSLWINAISSKRFFTLMEMLRLSKLIGSTDALGFRKGARFMFSPVYFVDITFDLANGHVSVYASSDSLHCKMLHLPLRVADSDRDVARLKIPGI